VTERSPGRRDFRPRNVKVAACTNPNMLNCKTWRKRENAWVARQPKLSFLEYRSRRSKRRQDMRLILKKASSSYFFWLGRFAWSVAFWRHFLRLVGGV